MKASLDTNIIIHLYRAECEWILFDEFSGGIYMYEQIRNIELQRHGQGIMEKVEDDIAEGKIQLITNEFLKANGVFKVFQNHVRENELLYTPKDRGEVYAISLAQTLGTYSLLTDDIKQGGPYMSLLQFIDNDILPFDFTDILLLRYLEGKADARAIIDMFEKINRASLLGWKFESHIGRFIRRFWSDPYQENEKEWMRTLCRRHNVNAKIKMIELQKALQIHCD